MYKEDIHFSKLLLKQSETVMGIDDLQAFDPVTP